MEMKFLQIEPAGVCNLRCPMCTVQVRGDTGGNRLPLMPFGLFRRIIDGAGNIGRLHLQGIGEPFLHPRFFDMAEYAAGKGITVTANTNGTVLNSAAARRCAEGALDTLYVSVDGATKETYESIRRGASFERLLRNLDLLIRTVKAKGAGKPRVIFVTVLMKRNMEELPGILALAKMFSVGAVYTQQLCHNFAEPSLIKSCGTVIDFVDKESLFGSGGVLTSKVFAAARRKAERLGIELHLPKERYRLRTTARAGHSWCDWPWKGFYVSWQGEIMPCCMVSLPGRYSLGSAERTTLRNMENNRRLAGLRRRLSAGRPPLFCAACPLYYGMF